MYISTVPRPLSNSIFVDTKAIPQKSTHIRAATWIIHIAGLDPTCPENIFEKLVKLMLVGMTLCRKFTNIFPFTQKTAQVFLAICYWFLNNVD
jgi:hypothetical protein